MKRRELLLIAGVLVPFFTLVALGFWWSPRGEAPVMPGEKPPPSPSRSDRQAPPGAPVGAKVEPVAVVGPVDAGPGAPLDAGAFVPRALEAPLRAVEREVRRCFADAHAPEARPLTVAMRFTPLPDGGFGQVRVESDSAQDPYLDACLTDAFEELAWPPSGHEDFQPARWTFTRGTDGGLHLPFDPRPEPR